MLYVQPTKQYPEGETRETFNSVLAQILPEKKTVKYYPVGNASGMASMVQAQNDLDKAYVEVFPKYPDYRHAFMVNFTGMVDDRQKIKLTPSKAALESVRSEAKS